ncbi:MAG TPA: phosphatase PAP2 family protein [Pricia sp.]|uniref:Phosphatase PAP2 family protein n=1 Tax=Pricia antarctica TaxID=641691 RepID=A0A831VS61_9FLAO|nr:phosphatase PAP2 family protein [Pricia sp.]HEA22368.1 phosphatase PAP2 family protein [Pricia antarctica]
MALNSPKTIKFIGVATLVLVSFLYSQPLTAQNKAIETTGDIILFALPATAFSSSLIIGDSKGTFQFSKGFVLNQALTIGIKYATNKKRPYNNGDRAFPSGHTSTTFQSAAFIQRRYGWKYGIPAYALAGFTGYSRIEAQRHDGWDILAGAAIGIGSAYLFTTPYQKEHMKLTFTSWDYNYALGFIYNF